MSARAWQARRAKTRPYTIVLERGRTQRLVRVADDEARGSLWNVTYVGVFRPMRPIEHLYDRRGLKHPFVVSSGLVRLRAQLHRMGLSATVENVRAELPGVGE